MTLHVTTPTPWRVLGRAAAGLGLGSAAVHLLLLAQGGSGRALAMAAMALVCLPCAWHLWRRPSARVWAVVAAVDATMLALHLRMLTGQGAGGEPMAAMHMHTQAQMHPASAALAPARLGSMWLGLAVVLAQLCVAAAALLRQDVHQASAGAVRPGRGG